ncbi:B2CL1 protein, partial [Polyodon spathula]|nr:B2CL1 protein [Polyodon spathula]
MPTHDKFHLALSLLCQAVMPFQYQANEELQHGPAVTDTFAAIYGKDAAAESRRSRESFMKWLFAGMTLATGLVVGSYFVRKRL